VRLSASVIRFVLEAAFIVAVAAATAIAHLDKLWIALSVGGAWVLVTLVERTAKQDEAALLAGPLALLFRRSRMGAESRDDPWAEVPLPGVAEEQPLLEHPEPEPPAPDPPAPEPAPPAPEPEPPRPEPRPATPQLRTVPPPPSPEAAPKPPQEGAPVLAFRPRGDGPPREWNVWALERIAREHEGVDPARDEELTFLLLELRQFANADGQLPASFDAVVREAFGEATYSGV
jgi:hypothetical protein